MANRQRKASHHRGPPRVQQPDPDSVTEPQATPEQPNGAEVKGPPVDTPTIDPDLDPRAKAMMDALEVAFNAVRDGEDAGLALICLTKQGQTIKIARSDGQFITNHVIHSMLIRQSAEMVQLMDRMEQQERARANLARQKQAEIQEAAKKAASGEAEGRPN